MVGRVTVIDLHLVDTSDIDLLGAELLLTILHRNVNDLPGFIAR